MLNRALRLIRVYHDVNQSEAAERLGISKSYLSEIESGKKEPTLDVLKRYSESFKIPLSSILFFSESLLDNGGVLRPRQIVASKVLKILEFLEEKSDAENKKELQY